MANFTDIDQMSSYLEKLNTCYATYRQWEKRKAHKNHTDFFGIQIKDGEYYYRLSLDGYLENDLKLSETNMAKFLFLLFAPFPSWEAEADKAIQERLEKAREKIN